MHSIKGVRSLTSSHYYLADANSRPMPNAVLDPASLVLASNDTTPGRVPANDDGGPSFALRIVLSSEKHASAHHHPPVCRPFRKHFQHQIGCLFRKTRITEHIYLASAPIHAKMLPCSAFCEPVQSRLRGCLTTRPTFVCRTAEHPKIGRSTKA